MLSFLAKRLASALVTIVTASLLIFVILRAVPTNPARLIAGPFATAETLHALVVKMGLDKPLIVQYLDYVLAFLRGDWGFSFSAGQPVAEQILERLPASVELGLFAMLIAFGGAIIFAVLASYSRSRWADAALRLFSFFCVGLPPFWISLVLLVIFFESLGWLPGPEGRGPAPAVAHTGFYVIDAVVNRDWSTLVADLRALILPAIALALALAPLGYLVRLLRANLLDVAGEPFVTVLKAKGVAPLTAHVVHVLPNAFIPTLTAGGLIFAQLLGGSVLVERVFAWPGVGALVVDGILRQDYAVVQAFIMLSAIIYIVVNLGVDLLYGVVDPRIRRP